MLRFEELAQLIDKLDQSSVAYLEVTRQEERLLLAKEVPQQVVASVAESTGNSVSTQPLEDLKVAPEVVSTEVQQVNEPAGRVVKSPIVGVVYLQPNPEAEVYVNVGDTVKKGDVLCLIEAMKLMNEITAPQDGVVTEILVTNEMVVEYNQPLIRIQ